MSLRRVVKDAGWARGLCRRPYDGRPRAAGCQPQEMCDAVCRH